MFKIESYIAPLLMGYIDKYVKLRTEDFQLSLWGGDVVLNNLDLRLDVIEHAIQLPIIFKSGHIHELRMHVPWTKLRSEPVVITINTIECILKVRDTGYEDSSSKSTSSGIHHSGSQQKLKVKQKPEAADLPPGYLQSLVNKIVNNVNIIVNNLILKFVEDDIVLSINVKSAECYSVDKDWARAFVELSPLDLVLRKVVSFCDLTVCLDKSDASGKIEMYQDPVVYRSSITCRLHTAYDSVHSKFPSITKLNIFCDKLELTLTDTQLPMFIRLVQLCLALYYGTIDMSSSTLGSDEPVTQEVVRSNEMEMAENSGHSSSEYGVGWGEWAWSFVPQILPEGEEELEGGDTQQKSKPVSPIFTIGLYIPKASISFKLTESIRESIHYGPNKVTFKPMLFLEAEGIGLEILVEGLRFFNVQFGITNLQLTTQGECVCGQQDSKHTRSSMLLHGGSSLTEPRSLSYTSDSLFDPLSSENKGETTVYSISHDSHMELATESFGSEKFGLFWFDYIYTIDVPEDFKHGSKSSTSGDGDDFESTKENASLRFLFGRCTLNVNSSLVHRVNKFLCCAANHQYEPYSRTSPEHSDEDRTPPSDQQIQALEEFIPTRTYHLTFVQPIINVLSAEHAHCDVKKKKRSSSSKKSQKSKSPSCSNIPAPTQYSLPSLRATADRFDLQISMAMYADKLVSLVSKMAGPSSNLLHHCYSHTQIKLFSFQVGLTRIDSAGCSDSVLTVLPACSGAVYKRSLLRPTSWQNQHLPHVEWMFEIPSVTVSSTKPQLLLIAEVYSSWQEKTPRPWLLAGNSLLEDTFRTTESKSSHREPLLEITSMGIELKQCTTPLGFSATGTLASLQAVLYARAEGGDCIIPILCAPASTQHLRSPVYFSTKTATQTSDTKQDWVTFTFQVPTSTSTAEVPAVALVEVTGMSCCLDPMIYQWLLYSPRLKTSGIDKPGAQESKVFVDLALANAVSPLNQSQLSAHSESSVKEQSDSCQTPTNTQTPTHGQTQAMDSSPTPGFSTSRENPRQTDTKRDPTENDQREESEDIWGRKCAAVFPMVRILQIQVEVASFCIFLPKSTVLLHDAGMDIAENLRGVFCSGTLPDTLVVSLPSIRIQSCGLKPMSVLQEIPIPVLEGTLRGEKLPWSVQVAGTSVYTLHKMRKAFPLLKPVDFSCTVAVSSKFSPPTSDIISALGVCTHLDMTGVKVTLSAIQIQTLAVLVTQITGVSKELASFWGNSLTTSGKKPSFDPSESRAEVPVTTQQVSHPIEPSTTSGGAEAVTTETSEDVSREATPSRELEIEEIQSPGVRLSFWLQWTLPKLELKLYGTEKSNNLERCVLVQLEELSTSIDLQEVYGKVKSKVGMAGIHHYVKKLGENFWVPGQNEGLLLSGPSSLPRNIKVVSNKLWTNDSLPSPMGSLYTVSEAASRDKKHGLLSFTFTRALCKNVRRRMRKLNVELAGLHDDVTSQVQEMLANNYRKYISEVCLNVEPCDVILFKPAFCLVMDVFTLPRDLGHVKIPPPTSLSQLQLGPKLVPVPKGHNSARSMETTSSIKKSPFSSASIPLMYVNLSNIRLFVPVSGGTTNPDTNKDIAGDMKDETGCKNTSTLNHNMFLLQFSSLSLNPQAENPLSRYVLEKELYRRALHAGITQHPGSQLEDRQYQLDLKGLAFCSGVWKDFTRRLRQSAGGITSHNPSVQIPAVEWNNLVTPAQKETDIRVIPLASRFDFKIVLAPAIVYSPLSSTVQSVVSKEPIVVCGHAMEINIISDLDFHLSTSQLNLLHNMVAELSAPCTTGKDSVSSQATTNPQLRGEQPHNDSGVESDASTANTLAHVFVDGGTKHIPVPIGNQPEMVAISKGPASTEITPIDILLTAGRITCMLYSHKMQADSKNISVGKGKSKLGQSKSRRSERDKKGGRYGGKKGSYRSTWSSCGYLADESSDEFEGNYDPSAHLRFMNIHATHDSQKSCDEDSGIILVPFLYCYFSQPHAVVSIQPDAQKIELSCYDVMLKGAAVDHVIKVDYHKLLPDCSDYATHWLETRAGSPDLKTGVPASLITVRGTDLLQGPAQISVELERPLKLSASLSKLLQVQQFMSDSVATWGTESQAREGNSGFEKFEVDKSTGPAQQSSLPGLVWLAQRVKSVEVQTEQVILYGETLSDDQSPFVLVAFGCVSADVEFQLTGKEQFEEIAGNIFAKDILVKTGFENKARPLIGPFTVNADCVAQWGKHSGPEWLPRVTIVTDIGLVTIELGQEHVLCFEMIQEHLTEFFQADQTGCDQSAASSSSQDQPHVMLKKKNSEEFIVDQSCDDLKTSTFQYIVDEGEGLHPNPGEIVFGVETDAGRDTMTWSYNHPRVISHLSVSPVPFNVSDDGSTDQVNLLTKIPCTLQFWDVMTREFVDYQEFFLSEDEVCRLILPDVKPHVNDLVVALMWRVVMSGHSEQTEQNDANEGSSTSSAPKSSSVVLPMSLAACIRVDSCFVPSLIPALQLSLSVSLIEIHLSNHVQHIGDAIPAKLQPFFAHSMAPLDQEFAVITIDNPELILSMVQGLHARTTIDISAAAQLDIVEYKFLTKQTILESTSFRGNVTVIPETESLTVDCSVDVDPMMMRLGKGAVHTLNCAAHTWSQVLNENIGDPCPKVIFNHYIICNDTQQNIRFGQVGSDENLCVLSREMNLYSWRTQTLPQRLHLCLDGTKWQWCEAFDVVSEGTVVRKVTTCDQTYTLIIRIRQLSNVHTQVIISGQLMVSSRLSHTMELKMLTGASEQSPVEVSALLGPGTTAPSWVLEESNMRSFKVRLTSIKTMWSQEVFVSGDRMKESRLVKIPLHDRGRSIHIWCQIYHQQLGGARQTLVLLSPLYVVRSHLPNPLYINIDTIKLKAERQVEALGQGRELELQCMGGDLTHQLTFQLGPSSQKSSPAVSLYSGLIEQVNKVKLDRADLYNLCYDWKKSNNKNAWPFTNEANRSAEQQRESPVPQRTNTVSSTLTQLEQQPNVDLNVSLLEYWPGCNTILVTVTPWCLLVNHSGLDLIAFISQDDSDWLEVANGNVLAPPQFQNGLRLGIKDDEGIAVCPVVKLSDEEWSVRRHRSESTRTLYTEGYAHVSVIVLRHKVRQVCFLTLISRFEQGMRIVTVKERYAVSSLVPGIHLDVASFGVPLGHQVSFDYKSLEKSELTLEANKSKPGAQPLLFWRVLPGEATHPEELSFVQYLCLRNVSAKQVSDWACPIRVSATENGTRSTVTLPKLPNGSSDVHTIPLVLTGHLKNGVTYLVIQEDTSPSFVIHNRCSFPLSFGQSLVNISVPECTVQEETELCKSVPTVAPGCNFHYTLPYVNSKFPELYDASSTPRLHLKPLTGPLEQQTWSSGVDLSQEQDRVISMEQGPDLKLHIEKIAILTHVVVEVVSKAEISAKEIRSRIKGDDESVVLSTTVYTNSSVSNSEEPVFSVETTKSITKKLIPSLRRQSTKSSERQTRMSVGVFLRHFCFVMLDESSLTDNVGEVLRVSLDNVYLTYYPVGVNKLHSPIIQTIQKSCIGICIGNMQIDNQCFQRGQFDFPVMLVRQDKSSEQTIGVNPEFFSYTVIEKHAYLRRCSLIQAQLVRISSPYSTALTNDSLDIAVQPLCIYVDDCFIYRILKEVEVLLPTRLSSDRQLPISTTDLPASVLVAARCGADPAVFRHLTIQPIKLLLSVHASLKVFIASDQTPLTFGKFERNQVFTTSYQLVKTLVMHYVSGAIFRAGLVVGSLDVLGNPTGLVRSLGNGVADLFRLPYAGLSRSPGAFVAGISSGMSSFLRNISAGTISSITNFAASVSRNMDRLSLDSDHFARQELNRKTRPAGISHGIKQGLTGLGLSLLGAVAGLADQPIQGAIQNQQAESRATATATGIVSGMGKGLMGVVTKPIGGAAEFVSQTGQGFLHSTGLVKMAEHRYKPVEEPWSSAPNSRTKHVWKILHSLPPGNSLIMELPATQYDAAGQEVPVILLLTTDILFVLSCEEDSQQQAFTAVELECVHRMNEPSVIALTWHDSIHHNIKQDATTDRVAEFIDKSSSFVSLAGLESSVCGTAQKELALTSPGTEFVSTPRYEFHVDPNYRDTFITLLNLTKKQLLGKGFLF